MGMDLKVAIHAVIPQISDEEIEQMEILIARQPDAELMTRMLGLDGVPTNVNRKVK